MCKEKLWKLRQEIALCSIFYSDYENSLDIDTIDLLPFFDGYADYLQGLMREDGFVDDAFFDELGDYDNADNLKNYFDYECSEYFRELLNAC